MAVEGFEDTNCPLCGQFGEEPYVGLLADAVVAWRKYELATGDDFGLVSVREIADKIIAQREDS